MAENTLSLERSLLMPTLASSLIIFRYSSSYALAIGIEFSNISTVAKCGICLIHITNCLRRTTNASHFWFNWAFGGYVPCGSYGVALVAT